MNGGFIDGCISNALPSAPEAQCLLAPRFSVGYGCEMDVKPRRGDAGFLKGHDF